jgi:hypothetical protein
MGIKCFLVEAQGDGTARNVGTGDIYPSLSQCPPGAMWNADWMLGLEDEPYAGPDGLCLVVKLPNGNDWMIDGIANNCTDRDDALRAGHKCWVRHGAPPLITVDKAGKTCSAGAGSILSGSYHGFLKNGELVEC